MRRLLFLAQLLCIQWLICGAIVPSEFKVPHRQDFLSRSATSLPPPICNGNHNNGHNGNNNNGNNGSPYKGHPSNGLIIDTTIDLQGYPDYVPDTNRLSSRYAFAGVLLNNHYTPGLIALAHTIHTHQPQIPFILLFDEEGTSESTLALLKKHPIDKFIGVPRISNPFFDENKGHNKVFEWTFTKLHVWKLDEYDRVIFVDLDFLFLGDVTDLFVKLPLADLYAAPDACPPSVFNSGFMVLRPSRAVFEDMMVKMHQEEYKSYEAGDQGFLNLYFPDWVPLRSDYNYLKFFSCARGRNQAYLENKTMDRIKGIHYTGTKPWQCANKTMDCNLITRHGKPYGAYSMFAHHGLHALWWRWYDNVCEKYPCPLINNQIETTEK